MTGPSPSLLAYIRCHRGMWLLAALVLVLKLLCSTECLAHGEWATASVDGSVNQVLVTGHVATAADIATDTGAGHGGHCVCGHTSPLPLMMMASLARLSLPSRYGAASQPARITRPSTLFRPPIA